MFGKQSQVLCLHLLVLGLLLGQGGFPRLLSEAVEGPLTVLDLPTFIFQGGVEGPLV